MRTASTTESCAAWHVLAEESVVAAEFSIALSRLVPVISWLPEMSYTGLLKQRTRSNASHDAPSLRKIHFPLQRGYARLPREIGAGTFRNVLAMLMDETADPAHSVLVCTSSFWAPTAALWPGPVVYYATDRTAAYSGLSRRSVVAADRSMCQIADLVCPNSPRLGDYFTSEAGCAAEKIFVVPNATRAANIRQEPFEMREELPVDVPELPRPIAGVIGNMGNNIDWELVGAAMEAVPQYSWLFVGPVPRSVLSRRNHQARAKVLASPRALFIGSRPHQELYRYARGLDVAIMPYNRVEPTFSGSSTRFYEHLAAGRPMLATRGVEELLHKEPLLTLVDSADELALRLQKLLAVPSDYLEAVRCLASRSETWEARAVSMRKTLLERGFDCNSRQPAPAALRSRDAAGTL